ncbi:unknown [Bacteroides sp. CAG:144]|nr:unknown [Bacteroides sp. CAG:144]
MIDIITNNTEFDKNTQENKSHTEASKPSNEQIERKEQEIMKTTLKAAFLAKYPRYMNILSMYEQANDWPMCQRKATQGRKFHCLRSLNGLLKIMRRTTLQVKFPT